MSHSTLAPSRFSGRSIPMPERVSGILQPPPRLSVSHWVDRHRYLSSRFTAEPGPFRMARTPYMREPHDAFTDPTIFSLTFIKPSRVGGTEWGNNLMAYTGGARPMPIMYALPQETDVHDEFKGRLRTVFESSRELRKHIPAGEWAGRAQISLDNLDIYGAWATSPATMIRKTIGFAYFDEIENCAKHSGALGDTLDLLDERLVTFGYRAKRVASGTPTTSDAPGWKQLQSSDFRKCYVPCPHCGEYQVLKFDQIKLAAGFEDCRDGELIIAHQLGQYECEFCEERIDHGEWHRWMIDRCVWIPKTQEPAKPLPPPGSEEADEIRNVRSLAVPPYDPWDDRYEQHVQWTPALEGEPPVTRHRGYWLNVLYSPWESRTWSHILARWFGVKDDPERRRVFMNSWLGQAWEDTVEKTDIDVLRAKRENSYAEGFVPAGIKILLMGADVQIDRIYYVIRGWGPMEQSALIREGIVSNFEQLYHLAFYTGFPLVQTPHVRMRCHSLGIDSRYRQEEVYQFAKKPGVVAMKGQSNVDYRFKGFTVDHDTHGKRRIGGLMVYHVNTDFYKSKITRLMNSPPGQPNYWALHKDTTEDYLKEVTAEHQKREKMGQKGRQRYVLTWVPKTEGAANHRFDSEVYGAALADMIQVPLMTEASALQGLLDGSMAAKLSGGMHELPPTDGKSNARTPGSAPAPGSQPGSGPPQTDEDADWGNGYAG